MSEKVSITITEALRERKLLKKRIALATQLARPFGIVLGEAQKPEDKKFENKEQLVNALKSLTDSPFALIERYNKLVAAIIKSNATTNVVVAGETLTVADAVERRQSQLMMTTLINQIEAELARIAQTATMKERELNDKIDRQVRDNKTEAMNADDIKALVDETTARLKRVGSVLVVDPCNIREQLMSMKEKNLAFFDELETKLNIVNATTTIEI